MEEINLVKSGKILVQTLIEYLAKDAIGGEFLREYLESRENLDKSSQTQRAAMDHLKEGTKEMGAKAKEISENASKNIQRLDEIALAVAGGDDGVACGVFAGIENGIAALLADISLRAVGLDLPELLVRMRLTPAGVDGLEQNFIFLHKIAPFCK